MKERIIIIDTVTKEKRRDHDIRLYQQIQLGNGTILQGAGGAHVFLVIRGTEQKQIVGTKKNMGPLARGWSRQNTRG